MSVKFLSEIAVRCQFIKVHRSPSRLDNKIRIGLASVFVNFMFSFENTGREDGL